MVLRAIISVAVAGSLLANSSWGVEKQFTESDKNHWAFQKINRPSVPKISSEDAPLTPIDSFVRKALNEKRIAPSGSADRITLIRRASLDLAGLPPTPEEVQAFLDDRSPEAFERVIDRLLLSPHYGERWARHWLDLARYAESEGFKADETRPNAWRYRDYVIKSFNEDKPYDRFLMEQIAGDELWPDNPDAIIATGFNRHYPDESNARNLMQRRQEILNDITDTVALVFTGLTVGCARCHDHKFDPILQKDYYRLQAFFANAAAADTVPLLPKDKLAEYNARLAAWEAATHEIRAKMAEIEKPVRESIIDEYVEKYPPEIQAALGKAPEDRSAFECQMVAKAELYISPASHQYIAKTSVVAGRLKNEQKQTWESLDAELEKFEHLHPGELPLATAVMDISGEAPRTYLLKGGSWEVPLEEVQPGFLTILDPAPTPPVRLPHAGKTGRRAALARILTDPENPLVPRVIVNRIWQYHFGAGIAATSSDFGMKGEGPVNPELLDWLATEFVQNGWSMKKLHKTIMLSATYQQSSLYRAEAAEIDPQNKLLWRFPRQRLEGEVIRDAGLAVSGLLNREIGGPSVFPELPSGMEGRGGWKTSKQREDRNRRSIYVFVRRNLRYPMFESFDMPDTHESCSRRNRTTSPLQALTMINNKVTLEWAQAFASRVIEAGGTETSKQVQTAFRLAFARQPSPGEVARAEQFFAEHREILKGRLSKGESLALPLKHSKNVLPENAATLVDFCHVLLNSNEFVYLN